MGTGNNCKLAWPLLKSHIRPEEWKVVTSSPLSYESWPTASWFFFFFFAFCNCSNLDDLTLYPMSSASVSDTDAISDPNVGKLEQRFRGWEI